MFVAVRLLRKVTAGGLLIIRLRVVRFSFQKALGLGNSGAHLEAQPWVAEAGGSGVPVQPGLHGEFKGSPAYVGRPCPQRTTKVKTNQPSSVHVLVSRLGTGVAHRMTKTYSVICNWAEDSDPCIPQCREGPRRGNTGASPAAAVMSISLKTELRACQPSAQEAERQEGPCDFRASLHHTVRPCLKNPKRRTRT